MKLCSATPTHFLSHFPFNIPSTFHSFTILASFLGIFMMRYGHLNFSISLFTFCRELDLRSSHIQQKLYCLNMFIHLLPKTYSQSVVLESQVFMVYEFLLQSLEAKYLILVFFGFFFLVYVCVCVCACMCEHCAHKNYLGNLHKFFISISTPRNYDSTAETQEFELLTSTHVCQLQVVPGLDLKKY